MNEIVLMLQFFTTIPFKREIPYEERKFQRTAGLLPVLGLLMGLIEIGTASMLLPFFRRETVLILVLLLETSLTGGIHLDGLADTCDGVFSGRDRKKMLEIMKDSRVGTFGVLALLLLLLLKGAFFLETEPEELLRVMVILPVLGRSILVYGAYRSVYAREKGFGTIYIGKISGFSMAFTFLFSLILAWVLLGFQGAFSVLGVYFLLTAVKVRASKLLGGMTGDVLGAMLEVSELLFLVVYLFVEKLF